MALTTEETLEIPREPTVLFEAMTVVAAYRYAAHDS